MARSSCSLTDSIAVFSSSLNVRVVLLNSFNRPTSCKTIQRIRSKDAVRAAPKAAQSQDVIAVITAGFYPAEDLGSDAVEALEPVRLLEQEVKVEEVVVREGRTFVCLAELFRELPDRRANAA